jgi:Putative adhesin
LTVTTPAAPKARPAVLAAAVLMVVLVCGTGAFALLSELVTSTVERTNAFASATGRLVVDADSDVTIGPSSDGRVHVHTVVRHGLGEPEIVQESTPEGVRLAARCSEFLAVHCDVRHEVQVPPAIEVLIDGVDGDVTASRLSGPLTVDRLTGDITVVELSGPLDLRTRSGEITGEGLRGGVLRAASDTGDVQLELVAPPRSVDVTTGDGEIDLAVPDTTAYRVDVDSGSGEKRVLVPLDPTSAHTLRVDGGTGDVTVRPTG